MENGANNTPKKRSVFLPCLVTGLIAFILGFVLAFSLKIASCFSLLNAVDESNNEQPSNTLKATELPKKTPGSETTVTPTADATVEPIFEEMNLDGKLPVITDNTNPIPEIVEQLASSIVSVSNYDYSEEFKKDVEQGSGTGFVISTGGYIITNAHVVEEATKITVSFSDGEEIDAQLIGFDKSSDVALIKIDAKYVGMALALGDSDNVRIGEFVIAIGDPTGRELAGTPTFGIISAKDREINVDGRTNSYIQTDAAINPGNSGGPLLNMRGEVIGITSAKTVTASYDEFGNAIAAEGLGFAIPINTALDIANRILKDGGIERPGIGVSVSSIDETQAEYYDVPTGALIVEITKGGKGEEAGLKAGDIVTECDGQKIKDQDHFVDIIKKKSVGDEVKLKVWRDGKTLEITVGVGDLNKMSSEVVDEDFSFDFGR